MFLHVIGAVKRNLVRRYALFFVSVGLLLNPKTTHLSGIFVLLNEVRKDFPKQVDDQWIGMTSQIVLGRTLKKYGSGVF